MSNPFYVEPRGDITQGLKGLQAGLESVEQRRNAAEQYNQAMEVYQSGDPDRIAEFSIRNPAIGKAVENAVDHQNKRTKENYFWSMYQVLLDDSPENVASIVENRKKVLASEGVPADKTRETDQFLSKFQQDPERAKRGIEMELAARDPARYQIFKKSTQKDPERIPDDVAKWNKYQEYLAEDPQKAERFAVAVKLGGTTEKPLAAPTDIDDFVADADAEFIRATGVPLTPGQRNEARLKFKRAQASEVAMNRVAEKTVDANTAQAIAYNAQTGTELAKIATAADLIRAKGETTPVEKRVSAKARMTTSLATLAKSYVDLDSSGAILNVENKTMNNIFASARSSSLGQAVGTMTGTKEQSIRNTIKSMKPLLIQDIRQSTDMGARGLDSEKELAFYLQASTDEKKDIQSNLAAIAVLDEAYGNGTIAAEIRKTTPEAYIKEIADRGREILGRKAPTSNQQPPPMETRGQPAPTIPPSQGWGVVRKVQ